MFHLFNIIGLMTFAFSGAVKGIQKNMDVFGITVLGLLTALGGGAVRDILVNKSPEMLRDFSYAGFALLGLVLAMLTRKSYKEFVHNWVFLLSDALGLAMFTVSGCLAARQNNLGVIGFIILGLSTAVGGGILRDVMAGEVPLVLVHEFYASCALAGSLLFWLLLNLKMSLFAISGISMLTVFVLRVAAIKYDWRLPKFS
jgi:uncharacterized membrane protein YeiH